MEEDRDNGGDRQIVESMIRVHDGNSQFRKMMSANAPRLHLKLKIIRAQRLLLLVIPIFLASIGLVIFTKSFWFALGLGGLLVSLVHSVYLWLLLRRD